MEERSPNADATSVPAAPSPIAPAHAPAEPDPELEAAIAAIDSGPASQGAVVVAPMPAAILALDPKPSPKKKKAAPSHENGEAAARTSDAVANALRVAQRAAQEAKDATDDAADDVADALIAMRGDRGDGRRDDDRRGRDDGKDSEDASEDDEIAIEDPEPSLTIALEEAQAAVRAAVKATDDAADHVADEILASTRGADEGDVVEDSVASRGNGADDDPANAGEGDDSDDAAAALAAHRKAVASGRSTRAHPRARASFEVRYRKGAEQVVGKGRNVSTGGFFVETAKLLPEGEVFQAQLLFEGPRKMSVIAEAMWISAGDPENPERFPSGMGCKFLDVDDKDIPFVRGIVDAALSKK